MTESAALQRFIEVMKTDDTPGLVAYPLDPFRTLLKDDREAAIALMLEGVSVGDLRSGQTLVLAQAFDAIPGLKALSARGDDVGTQAARAALALEQARGGTDPELVARLADGVQQTTGLGAAMNAYALRFQDGPDAIRGLLDALSSRNLPARANAWLGLQDKLGLDPLLDPPQSPLSTAAYPLRCSLRGIAQEAGRTLAKTVGALAAAHSPAELGLVYERASDPDAIAAFSAAVSAPQVPWDLDAFRALAGHDRAWATAVLVTQIWSRPDAADAAAELGLTEAVPALREAVERAFGDKKATFEAALKRLT